VAKLYFNIRDLFRAARLGWSGKKMWIGFCGIAIAYVVHGILTYLSLLAAGAGTFGELWDIHGLFPRAILRSGVSFARLVHPFPWYSWVIYGIGAIAALFVVLCTAQMISKIAYRQLKGDDFYSMGDALKSLQRNWKAVLLAPITLFAIVAFFILFGIFVVGGLAQLIPYVGEILYAVFMVPVFFAVLLTVFMGIVLAVSLFLGPAIVGTTSEDTLETVIQLFSTVWSQPWRLVLYELWVHVTTWFAATVLSLMTYVALLLTSWACGLFMGPKLAGMLATALHYVPQRALSLTMFHFSPERIAAKIDQMPLLWRLGSYYYPSLMNPLPSLTGEPTGTILWSGRILAIMFLILVGFILSYALTTLASGQTLIYVALRKKKDDENLLEQKDREEQEEEDRQQREEEERKRKEEEEQKEKAEEEQKEEAEEEESGEEDTGKSEES